MKMNVATRAMPTWFYVLGFIGFISAAMLAPLASELAVPFSYDLLNHIASIAQAKLALSEGQFPIRQFLMPDNAFYYPNFQFYSPSSYTLAGLIHRWLAPSNPFTALKLTLWICSTIGGVYVYLLSYWFIPSKPAALLTSVAYLTAPYTIIVLTHLCGFNESIAISLMPIVFYYTLFSYTSSNSIQYLLPSSLSWYALITTHLITFIYSAIVLGFLFLIVTIKNRHHFKNLISISIGLTLACLMSMWFLAPILKLSSYFAITESFNEYHSFAARVPAMLGLFSVNANYQTAAPNNADLVSFYQPSLGLPIVAGILFGLYELIIKSEKLTRRARFWLPYLMITLLLTFILTTGLFNIWKYIPGVFHVGQYSWRLLSLMSLLGCLVLGWSFYHYYQHQLTVRHVLLISVTLVLSTSSWFPNLTSSTNIEDFLKSPKMLFNPTAYLLNSHKNFSIVDSINTFELDTLHNGKWLRLDTDYLIPRSLLDLTTQPVLNLENNTAADSTENIHLDLMANKQLLETKIIKPGEKIKWLINLKYYPLINSSKDDIKIQFVIQSKQKKKPNIPLDRLYLNGFYKKDELLPFGNFQKNCINKKTVTTCQFTAVNPIKFVELPAYYYPKLLKITLNGKIIPYESILENYSLLAAIKPVIGKNKVTIQFVGDAWANLISQFAFLIFALLALDQLLKKLKLFGKK
jgi:hypothetical protein